VLDYRAHSGCTTQVDASAALKGRVISAGADGCIRVCDAAALDVALVSLRVHTGSITSFVCYGDGTMWTGGEL
jgi:hypothetical protein